MKKCPWCGKEYSDEAEVCALDEQKLVQLGAAQTKPASIPSDMPAPLPAPPGEYMRYEDVPWLRRSGTAGMFVFVGAFAFAPLVWLVCFLCLTCDIYLNKTRRTTGYLIKWGPGNKIAAVIILILQLVFYGAWIFFRATKHR